MAAMPLSGQLAIWRIHHRRLPWAWSKTERAAARAERLAGR